MSISAISVLLWWHIVKQHSLVDRGRNAGGVKWKYSRHRCQMSWMWSPSQLLCGCDAAWHDKGQKRSWREQKKMSESVRGWPVNCRSHSTVANMALLNTCFQNKDNSSKTGLLWELLCHLSWTWSMKRARPVGQERVQYIKWPWWNPSATEITMPFYLSNKIKKTGHSCGGHKRWLSQACFWHQTHKRWFVTLGSWMWCKH